MGLYQLDFSDKMLLDVLMLSKDPTAIYSGADIQILFANKAMLRLWGKDRSIVGQPIGDAVPELRRQAFEGLLKQVWLTGKTYEAKDVAAELDQGEGLQVYHFDFVYRAILDESGQTKYILHSATEVTDRLQAWNLVREKEAKEQEVLHALQVKHQELTATEHRLQQLVLSSPVAMTILKGRDLVIEIPNDKMLLVWARTMAQVDGQRLLDVFPELLDQPFPELLTQVFDTGKAVKIKEISVTITDVDGSNRALYVDFAYEPLLGFDGQVDSIMATVVDITAVVAARTQLEDKEMALQGLNEALKVANEELQSINEELHTLNEEYQSTNEELSTLNEEYQSINEELNTLNEEYTAVNEELQATNDQVIELSELLRLANAGLRSDKLNLQEDKDALTDSLKRMFTLFNDAPVAIGLLQGEEMIVEYANPALTHLWGKDRSAIGEPLVTVLPELKGQPFLGYLEKVFRTGESYIGNGHKASLVHNGVMRQQYFNFTYKAVEDEEGSINAILIVAHEVTEQFKAKQSIDDAYERLRFALDVGYLGSYELDIHDKTIVANNYFKQHFGYGAEEEITFDLLLRAIVPEYREQVNSGIRNAISNKGLFAGEYQVVWTDGSRNWIKAFGRATYDESGKAIKVIGVTSNITEQKAFDQRKDDFLSIASHELKTPITTLKANLQLLDRFKEALNHPITSRLIDSSNRTVNKLIVMVDDLLDINRFTEGQVKLNRAFFPLKQLLEQCCSHIRIGGNYNLIVDGEEIEVFADESRIEQVLSNFVNNAVKYASESKDIFIGMRTMGDFVKVTVRDQGPGIAEEQLGSLFDRYWRADHSSKNYTGLGLGLFICAEIIRKHGGEIGAESILGEGATFWFTLPLKV